jgi:uncharacterized membrane protein
VTTAGSLPPIASQFVSDGGYEFDDPPPRRGCLPKLLVGFLVTMLALVMGVWVIGDKVVRPAVERRISEQLRRDYKLGESPVTRLDASPFLAKVARGSIDRATVTMGRFTSDGFTVESAELVATGLTFEPGKAMRGTGEVTAAQVEALVRVTPADLTTYINQRNIALTLTGSGNQAMAAGSVVVLGVKVSGTATGTVRLAGNTLTFRPTDVNVDGFDIDIPQALLDSTFAFDIPIPDVAGLKIRSATIVDGILVLQADATNYALNR